MDTSTSTSPELPIDFNSIPDTITLNSQQVADLLFTTKDQVEIFARKREIPAFKPGRSWVFPFNALMAWMDKRARDNIPSENDNSGTKNRRRRRRQSRR